MAWLTLFIAGLFEIGWAVGLKYTAGFTRLWPTVATAVAPVRVMSSRTRVHAVQRWSPRGRTSDCRRATGPISYARHSRSSHAHDLSIRSLDDAVLLTLPGGVRRGAPS